MKLFTIASAAVLLGCAGLTAGAFAQTPTQVAPQPSRAITGDQGTIIIRGPFYAANSAVGDLKLNTPGPMQNDSVYLDGTYVGVAGNISDVQLAPGAHDLMLCAPDGTPVYRHNVTVATNETTEVSPFVALDSGVNAPPAPSASYVPPAAPVYVPQPQPAEEGNLKLRTPYALRDDAVFIDGTYVGEAKLMKNLTLTAGKHEVALCAPNGMTDFDTSVGIAANRTTHLRPTLERPTLNG